VDLCSGSGCIPFLISHHLGDHLEHALGVDISDKAVALARDNAAALDTNYVEFAKLDIYSPTIVSDILARTKGVKASILTSNPPYISHDEWEVLPRSVKRYEDSRALLGDQDSKGDGRGLTFYRRIAELLPSLLRSEGEMSEAGWEGIPRVLFEIGQSQGDDVSGLLNAAGDGRLIARTEIWKDQYGKDRAIAAWTS
jgi:release factor glutamine methyltransferase